MFRKNIFRFGFLFKLGFSTQDVVVVLGKAMSFISHVLQQPQGECVPAQTDRLRVTGAIDFLVLFGQGEQHRRFDSQRFKGRHGAAQLTFAAVDQQNVGKHILIVIKSFEAT